MNLLCSLPVCEIDIFVGFIILGKIYVTYMTLLVVSYPLNSDAIFN